jgi:hypothetical protein
MRGDKKNKKKRKEKKRKGKKRREKKILNGTGLEVHYFQY